MNDSALIEALERDGRVACLVGDYLYIITEGVMEEGYQVDKYDVHDDMSEPMDGGFCYGTSKDAIEFML